jgi:proline iminopeptidase
MRVTVNGTRLWFDVEGPALVPDRSRMRERPTIVLVHGGPGSYDHSYFKPDFTRLAAAAQVVYLDLRGHGLSDWGRPEEWSYEVCADDLRAFCDALEIERPVVYGHSMGGWIVALYGARHPGHAGGLILQSTAARTDLDRLTDGFRRVGGDEIAELARRAFADGPVSAEEWARCFRVFGPHVPDELQLARRINNADVGRHGSQLFLALDLVDQLQRITSPTLVCVGVLDPVTPVAASQEIVDALRPDVGRLEILAGAGHFPWLDGGETYFELVAEFVEEVAASRRP